MKHQKQKTGGATHAPVSKSNYTATLLTHHTIVNNALAQWETEKQRLWSEYERTGNPAHLKAFDVHRAAMSARLANTAQAKYG